MSIFLNWRFINVSLQLQVGLQTLHTLIHTRNHDCVAHEKRGSTAQARIPDNNFGGFGISGSFGRIFMCIWVFISGTDSFGV